MVRDEPSGDRSIEVDRRTFVAMAGAALGGVALSGSAEALSRDHEPDTYYVGPAADRPAAGTPSKGTLYFATDTNRIDYTDGSNWQKFDLTSEYVSFEGDGTGSAIRSAASKLRETVSARDFGAVGDGSTDDSAAIQDALDSLGTTGGSVLLDGDGKFVVDSSLTVPPGCSLVGQLRMPDWRTDNDFAKTGSQVLLDGSATIELQESAGLRGLNVLRKGVTLPASESTLSNWTGTAVTVNADSSGTIPGSHGAYVGHSMFVGFDQAVESVDSDRLRAEYLNIDCTNGIRVENCRDIAYVENVHAWPFAGQLSPDSDGDARNLARFGTAFEYANTADWCKFTNCFSYGYSTGFEFNSVNNCTALGCGADYTPDQYFSGEGPTGFAVSGTSTETTLVGCQAAAQINGFLVASSVGDDQTVTLQGCTAWGNRDHGAIFYGGRVSVAGCKFRGAANGVTILDGGGDHTVVNCTFQDQTSYGISDQDGVPFQEALNTFRNVSGPKVRTGYLPSVASASTLGIDGNYDTWRVTGTTTVDDVANGWDDREVALKFDDALTVTDGNGIELDGGSNFNTTAGSTLTLLSQGGTWYEVARSTA